MEFNNINLPPFIVAGLYQHSLVLLDREITTNENGHGLHLTHIENQFIAGDQHLTDHQNLEIKSEKEATETTQIMQEVKKSITENNTVINDFQPSSVYEIATTPVPKPATTFATSNIKYLGGFGKKISIVLEDHFQPHLNDGDLAFLAKLLQACQLSLNDVAIINVVSNRLFSNQLWQLMPSEKMIIFDIDPGTLGLPFRLSHFKLQPWSDCVFLASPSLEALQKDASENVVQLKRNLWESLKKMFLV